MILKKEKTWQEEVKNTLRDIKDKTVVIGCSGGVDSMVLLDMIRVFGKANLIIAHVHHGLRKSADRDEKIVRDYCKKYMLKLEITKIDAKKEAKQAKMTVEEYARQVRKNFFESIREKCEADLIITAHHTDDQAETLIYRITKGTSITGLVGIEEHAFGYFRPLITVSKKEIIEYAQKNKIVFGYDETNDDTSIPRNRLRHNVIPELKKINPKINHAVTRLSESARELKISFDAFFTEVAEKKSFTLDWYHSLPIGFQHELLRFVYEKTNGSTHGLSTQLIKELDRFLSTRNGGKKEIKKMKLEKKQGKVIFSVMK